MIKIEDLQKALYFVLLSVTGVRCVNIVKFDKYVDEIDCDKGSIDYMLNVEICVEEGYDACAGCVAINNLAKHLDIRISSTVTGFFQR